MKYFSHCLKINIYSTIILHNIIIILHFISITTNCDYDDNIKINKQALLQNEYIELLCE